MRVFKFIKINTLKTIDVIKKNHISAFAAQSAFFVVISIFPMHILIMSFLDIIDNNLIGIYNIAGINRITSEFSNSSVSWLSVNTVLAAWSSGKTFFVIKNGLHFMMKIRSQYGYIGARIKAVFASIGFSAFYATTVILGVMGNRLLIHFDWKLIELIRIFYTLIVIFFITLIIYRFLPEWKTYKEKQETYIKMKQVVCVSVFVSFVVFIYFYLLSLYVFNYADYENIYKSMTSLVFVMILIYGSMFSLFFGFKVLLRLCEGYSCGISNL